MALVSGTSVMGITYGSVAIVDGFISDKHAANFTRISHDFLAHRQRINCQAFWTTVYRRLRYTVVQKA